MTEDEAFYSRTAEVLADEEARDPGWWWLSFADPNAPPEHQFLGVAIVRAKGPLTASLRARELGCNPGGEVVAEPIPFRQVQYIKSYERNRLLSKIEAMAIDGRGGP